MSQRRRPGDEDDHTVVSRRRDRDSEHRPDVGTDVDDETKISQRRAVEATEIDDDHTRVSSRRSVDPADADDDRTTVSRRRGANAGDGRAAAAGAEDGEDRTTVSSRRANDVDSDATRTSSRHAGNPASDATHTSARHAALSEEPTQAAPGLGGRGALRSALPPGYALPSHGNVKAASITSGQVEAGKLPRQAPKVAKVVPEPDPAEASRGGGAAWSVASPEEVARRKARQRRKRVVWISIVAAVGAAALTAAVLIAVGLLGE